MRSFISLLTSATFLRVPSVNYAAKSLLRRQEAHRAYSEQRTWCADNTRVNMTLNYNNGPCYCLVELPTTNRTNNP